MSRTDETLEEVVMTPEAVSDIVHRHLSVEERKEIVDAFLNRPGAAAAIFSYRGAFIGTEEEVAHYVLRVARECSRSGTA